MPDFSSPAILLRRMDYGDFDVIVTFFTLHRGKLSLIAKSAKKSTRRFGGVLELFSLLEIVGSIGRSRGKGMAVLQEAVLRQPFSSIRTDFKKTAYASYWAELIYSWLEENYQQVALYNLLAHVLNLLDQGHTRAAGLSVLFQMRLLSLSGHRPNLQRCVRCLTELENIKQDKIIIDTRSGGILCDNCRGDTAVRSRLGKGTIKQLLWVESGDLTRAGRIQFSGPALIESTGFLEEFVCYHLSKQPRSLKFLRQIRNLEAGG